MSSSQSPSLVLLTIEEEKTAFSGKKRIFSSPKANPVLLSTCSKTAFQNPINRDCGFLGSVDWNGCVVNFFANV
jgi:hypothetical protein